MEESIHIIQSAQINICKWNDCINHNKGLIYSQYEYVSAIADYWHGLIIGDYEAVMALPLRKKYGIKYIYTPPFMQQLGLIGKYNIEDITLFKRLKKFSSYITYNFNFDNQKLLSSIPFTEHTNLILSLTDSSESIQDKYAKSLQRNLQKAFNNGVIISEGNHSESIGWYRKYQGEKIAHVSNADYDHLDKLLTLLKNKGQLICKNALNKQGETIATIVCLKDGKRIYNLLPSSSEQGKELSAMHLLLDAIICQNAQSNYTFDFEGSDIKGVQQFYLQYGATVQPYYRIHQNSLPLWLKLIKKK